MTSQTISLFDDSPNVALVFSVGLDKGIDRKRLPDKDFTELGTNSYMQLSIDKIKMHCCH